MAWQQLMTTKMNGPVYRGDRTGSDDEFVAKGFAVSAELLPFVRFALRAIIGAPGAYN